MAGLGGLDGLGDADQGDEAAALLAGQVGQGEGEPVEEEIGVGL